MKIALITGASGGIGSAIAQRFAQSGYAVVLLYKSNPEQVKETARSFPADTSYLCVYCDIQSQQSVDEMMLTVHQRLGKVSVLINCAGVALEQKVFSDSTDEEYERIFETNVHGMMRVTKACIDDLRSQQGAVINMSSVWGVVGGSCEVLYSSSKAAVIGFTKSLAKELAPCGVTVNCIAPGLIPTKMNAHLSKQDILEFAQDTPLGRVGTPDDVADAALYLAEAGFVTGQILCCDGGYSV